MKKLLSSPVKMPLSPAQNQVYQNVLKYFTPLSLNLMAVKVTHRPDDFLSWCGEFIRLCREDLNMELLDEVQFLPLKKLQDTLESGFTISQFKMARIAPWPIFIDFVEQQNEIHAVEERLRLLSYIEDIRQQPLADLSTQDRLAFAGKHTQQHNYQLYNFDIEWFASTKGAKTFHLLLEQTPEKFDSALAHIPLTGDVTYEAYQQFVKAFEDIFKIYASENSSKDKAPLAAATRLLAMRRPDQFIALNNSKIDMLCKGLSIPKFNNTDFSSYWHDMIGTLRTCAWWHQEEPKESIEDGGTKSVEHEVIQEGSTINCERSIWKNRAILIDLFLFADDELAINSNFIRSRDKALNKPRATAKTQLKKRIKETAEEAVDKALAIDGLPDYLQNKRDSLVAQVKDGKSVEDAIALLRAIFG